MDFIGIFGTKLDSWKTFIRILTILGILHCSSGSDCDVEFIYSENFNSNGFKVSCKDIAKGQENLLRSIPAHNALLLIIKNATLINITSDIFENVPKLKELNIENSKILIDGHVGLFSKLEILQNLNLKNTQLKEIGNGTFNNLFQMRTLFLENNSISSIPKNSLNLISLETLNFINNELKDIEDIPLCNLPNIKSLSFRNNKIKFLKPDLYQCSSPKRTSAKENSIYENNHFSIESVDLSDNEITSLDGVFKSFTNLDHLELQNNLIYRISDTDFEMATDLDYLNLSNNSISVISNAAFSRLYKLTRLNLCRNKITNIQLKFLPELSDINLSYNQLSLKNIEGINYLPNLEHMDLSYNKLSGASNFFNNFPSLLTLNLNGNDVLLENETFLNLSKIEKLHLSYNGIFYLPDSVFKNMTCLIELDLSVNKLHSLEYKDVFASLASLQMLNLSYNDLKSLDYTLFNNLDNVEVLDIAANKLRDLNYALITSHMRALEVINIEENSFSCSFLHRMVAYFSWKGVNYKADNITFSEEENIGGIHCQEDIADSTNNEVKIGQAQQNTSIFVIVIGSAIFLIFSLMLIIIFKYYQVYKRRKYNCEQFELIED